MKVKYIGMFDEVEVAELADTRGFRVSVKRGEVVEVPDELGARLLGQEENWAIESKGESLKVKAEAPVAADPNTEAITPSEG